MKLSEAIRLGAMMGPKANGQFFTPDGGSCVQGSALRAMGVHDICNSAAHGAMRRLWPWIVNHAVIKCPACSKTFTVTNTIAHLSNGYWKKNPIYSGHDWDRHKIADFVATIEPQSVGCAEEAACQTHSMIG